MSVPWVTITPVMPGFARYCLTTPVKSSISWGVMWGPGYWPKSQTSIAHNFDSCGTWRNISRPDMAGTAPPLRLLAFMAMVPPVKTMANLFFIQHH